MFVRIRWFVAGIAAALGGVGFLAAQVAKARERLTPANLLAAGKNQAASWLDAAAEKLSPKDSPNKTGYRGR